MKDIALRAIQELTEKHNPEFIILYGSVVRGDTSENSDIDVACFCKSPTVAKDIRLFEGRKLDCWIYSIEEMDADNIAFLRFVDGQLFGDLHGIGRQFLADLDHKFQQGPEALTADARLHLTEWSKNMLDRAAGSDIESKYRRTWLPCELLEIYFQLRGMWFVGSKKSFAWLKENDASTYRLFDAAFNHPTDLKLLAALVRATLQC